MSGPTADTFPNLANAEAATDTIDDHVDLFIEMIYEMCPDLLAVNIQILRRDTPPARNYLQVTDAALFSTLLCFDLIRLGLSNTIATRKWSYREPPEKCGGPPRSRGRGHAN